MQFPNEENAEGSSTKHPEISGLNPFYRFAQPLLSGFSSFCDGKKDKAEEKDRTEEKG
jgi:hypothetical protein